MESGRHNLRPAYLEEGREEAERQRKIIGQLKERKDKPKTYFVVTMGCQMNARDSEKLTGILEEIGCRPSEKEENADLVVYNTCCVRENAEQKVYGRLGYLKSFKKKNPNMKIALCGCMMQEEVVLEKLKKSYPQVDLIFGTYNIYKFSELLQALLDGGGQMIDIWQEQQEIVEDLPSIRKHRFKASVNIMYGCNNFCTYCIVPYVRGRERSRKPENIIAEIQSLAEDGVKEIQLLGQNVNSYGKNLENPISFAKLLEMVNEIEGIERIRFMTSHPKDLSQELIEAVAKLDKVCPHFHLPLQSGSDRLLQEMNRRYDQAKYLDIVKRLKQAVPEIAITTDIIVGFPGETREDFLETVKVAEEVRFDGAFTFIYSKREGTPAAQMRQVDPEEAKENFEQLLEVLEKIAYADRQKWIGRRVNVLAEDVSKNDASMLSGRDEHNRLVHFVADSGQLGKTLPVIITEATAFYMTGRVESEEGSTEEEREIRE